MTLNYPVIGIWTLKIIAAVIMLQTLFFKFTAAEESVYIFSQLGMEPWGRIGTGILELGASVLILHPRTTPLGALLAAGLMSGAIWFHISRLGIVVRNDGGQLFIYAVLVFISSVMLLLIYRKEFTAIIKQTLNKIG